MPFTQPTQAPATQARRFMLLTTAPAAGAFIPAAPAPIILPVMSASARRRQTDRSIYDGRIPRREPVWEHILITISPLPPIRAAARLLRKQLTARCIFPPRILTSW